MATTHSNPEKDTDVPNEDARTERTCVVCGETDAKVDEHSLPDRDGTVAFHNLCAPPMPELADWMREVLDE